MDDQTKAEIAELMNSTAVRSHLKMKPGELVQQPKNILDFNGKKAEKSPMSPQLKKLIRDTKTKADYEIGLWIEEQVKEIIPEVFHVELEDFKKQTQLMNKFGIEIMVEFVKDPQKEGLCPDFTKLGAHVAYVTVKGQEYSAQVFIWEEDK